MNNAIWQAAKRPCPECGGQRVATSQLNAYYAGISTGFTNTAIIPVSCTNCGYTTFYTENPEKVKKRYLR